MYLLIDYRETDFIKRLSEICIVTNDMVQVATINNCEVTFRVTNLPVGDFIITEDSDFTNNPSALRLVIERKSISDLCSSITDGRFREQKLRLLQSVDDCSKICYMIQGSKQSARMSQTVVGGAITNLIFKHNYRVIQTENAVDTFQTVVLLYKKWLTNAFVQDTLVTSNVKLIRRSESEKSNRFINQLCLVSGVSVTVAKAISESILNKDTADTADTNVSLKRLIDLYNGLDESDRETYFADVKISATRRVGPALSKKIYMYFCT